MAHGSFRTRCWRPAARCFDAAQSNCRIQVEPDQVGGRMRAIDGCHGQLVTRTALGLSAMLFQRPGNIRQVEWGELDLDRGMWAIPSEKMKRTKREKLNGRPHWVPLAPQAVAA